MAGMLLETPSRIWRRIEEVEGEEMPSLPSLPAIEDLSEQPSVPSESMDISNISNPLTSTPATFKSSNTMTTIRPPGSIGSTARFAQSIASRSSKSSTGPMSVSRANFTRLTQNQEDSFDVSPIPSLPNILSRDQLADIEVQSSDHSDDHSVGDAYLPPVGVETDHENDLDLSDALRPLSRSNSPGPDLPGMTPIPRKYDYSISLKSEPQPSPFDRLRNVSLRRPLSRNARTPSLTSTSTPSPSSSTSSQPTPQSARSTQRQNTAATHRPSPAHIPLPRSATASPMPPSTAFATPLSARAIPLPRSRTSSPAIQLQQAEGDQDHTVHTIMTETDDDPLTSLPVPPSPSHDLGPSVIESSTDLHTQTETETETEHEDREPTFSSEEATREGGAAIRYQSLSPAQSQLFSPMQSALMTPTPAFSTRSAGLRARFNLEPVSQTVQSTTPPDVPGLPSRAQPSMPRLGAMRAVSDDWGTSQAGAVAAQVVDGPATPATAHKRSFLLSVINSTARPRMKFPTPHPHRQGGTETPAPIAEDADETVTPPEPDTVRRVAFAGATPRPAFARPAVRRLSHPLTQAWTAPSPPVASTSSLEQGPAQTNIEGASFVSTASSQDLAIHTARANASFDPVIGLGERGGHGVGRFNAGKLNAYLHGLNRRLEEENEELAGRLRAYEEKFGALGQGKESGTPLDAHTRRSSGRRVSAGPSGLGAVSEGWEEEKAALEEMIEELKVEVEHVNKEKDEAMQQRADMIVHADEVLQQNKELEQMLESEKEERAQDKERWQERMEEAEKGVAGLVDSLEQKRQEAERRMVASEKEKAQIVKDVERRLAEVVIERDVLAERLEKAERGHDVASEITTANERVAKVLGDLRNANVQIKDLEEEVIRSDERIDVLELELREEKKLVAELERELQVKSDELSQTLARINALETSLQTTVAETGTLKADIAQHEADAAAAVEHIESLTDQLNVSQEKLEAMARALDVERERSSQLQAEADRATELAKQMEVALDAAESKMRTDEEQTGALKLKVASLERELDRLRSHHALSQAAPDAEAQAQVEALEAELDEANREVARLNVLVSQSPARKAMEKAKDTKIELLEQERDDLLERVKSLRSNSLLITPGKTPTSKISPMHRQLLSMALKTPKTPGGPLRDLSWLQSTMNDPTVSPLVAEIERLQQELEQANEVIDTKLDRLEDAGVGVIDIAVQLEDAQAKIVSLEEEIARLARKEERRTHRLEKLRCQKCLVKIDTKALEQRLIADESSILSDASMAIEPPTPPTRTSEKLRQDLNAVNAQLASMKKHWDDERRKLIGDNAALQNATKRLNAEIREAKTENEKTRLGMQGELEKTRRMVDELEAALAGERSRLRSLSTEQSDAQRQKDEVGLQLRRAEFDMTEIRAQLQKIKQENRELEAELRSNANADQRARLLEAKVTENAQTIEQLRKERSLLATDHKSLQRHFTQVSEQVAKLREERTTSQTSHDQRRHELDLHLLEIEDLRRALSDRASQLEQAEADTARAASEKSDMGRSVAALEADLRRVRREAEAFGRDLKALRAQKDRLEEERARAARAQKQHEAEVRVAREEAREQRERAGVLARRVKEHVCAADGAQLDALRAQHKDECKGLIVQIRYLKAKWTRENGMRADLCNQKQYLLVLLARSDRTEQTVLAAIARIGYPALPTSSSPSHPSARKHHTLRSAVHAVVFLIRAKRASDAWREQAAAKEAIAAAYQEVRRRKPPV